MIAQLNFFFLKRMNKNHTYIHTKEIIFFFSDCCSFIYSYICCDLYVIIIIKNYYKYFFVNCPKVILSNQLYIQ